MYLKNTFLKKENDEFIKLITNKTIKKVFED